MLKKLNKTFLFILVLIAPVKGTCLDDLLSFDKQNFISFQESNHSNPSCFNSKKWDLFADLLFWYADQLETWAVVNNFSSVTEGGVTTVFNEVIPETVSFDWSEGFRVGAGYHIEHDGWDTQFSYTWYKTTKENQAYSTDTGVVLPAFLGNWLSFGTSKADGKAPNSAKIEWKILFNSFDWDLGRNYVVSKAIAFRPYFGIKGGWICQNIHTYWKFPEGINEAEHLKNNFWGVGPKGGVNSKWSLGNVNAHSFSLFGDGAIALLGGGWTFEDLQTTSANGSISSIGRPKTYAGTFMIQGLMGLEWDVCLNDRRSLLAMRLGFETQVWYDQLKYFTWMEGRLHNALTLQGLTFNVRYDF